MFGNCTSLTHTPKIKAITVDQGGVEAMFMGSGIVTAYDLEFTTMNGVDACKQMFKNCTNLVTAPALPCTTLQPNCYSNMFTGCTSLVNAPELPATTLANSCYIGMFEYCTSLQKAPELLAPTYVTQAYG